MIANGDKTAWYVKQTRYGVAGAREIKYATGKGRVLGADGRMIS